MIKLRKLKPALAVLLLLFFFIACNQNGDDRIPTIGFVDAFEDNTIEQAKNGFLAALEYKGFSEEAGTIKVIYRNAQGNIPTLTQIVKYFIAQKVKLIASSPSLSTITALQNTKAVPVFMMVSPTPELMQVEDADGKAPANLFGVSEDLAYIDSSFSLIPRLIPSQGEKLRVGLLYNQSEPQSVAAYKRLQGLADRLEVELISRPVNATADVQLASGALLNENIDAFFANPDNTVFGSFETIVKACNEQQTPVFTSEAGLVDRGAVAAYGADMYQWGYQAGLQAALFLETNSLEGLSWEMVKLRKKVYNPEVAERFGLRLPADFEALR